ncbi:STAS domain-containing protein [Kineococcus sp. GCM10028916]|uniref:STAS domain-containing protein n=1 Tax=Kineococcus sp. GCM10028916 TaxID=3273394 RepID=UPI00362E838F
MEFSVRRRTSGAVGVVEVGGELDAETADAFEACTLALLAEVRHVVVDLRDTAFVDCRGLSSLLYLSRLARTVGGGFRTTGARPVVRLLFDTLGVTGRLGADDVDTVDTEIDLRAPLHAVGR